MLVKERQNLLIQRILIVLNWQWNGYGIIKRNLTGEYASGSLSFMVQIIIQLYNKKNVEVIPLQTVAAFIRKNDIKITPKNKYQTKSNHIAHYLLGTEQA